MLDYALPTINVGIFPDESTATHVDIFPNTNPISVKLYNIGDMEPEDFFPAPVKKKKVDSSNMLCGSLATRELTLTSLPYPIHFQERLSVDVPEPDKLFLRNVYQRTSDLHGMTLNVRLKSLLKRHLYQHHKDRARTGIQILVPIMKALSIRNLYKAYRSSFTRLQIAIPVVTGMFNRNILQKLRSHPKDAEFKIGVPTVSGIKIRNLVRFYKDEPIHELSVGIPDLTELSLRNAYNKHTVDDEEFNIELPTITVIDTTIKPKVYVPELVGIENRAQATNELSWSDNSKTHSGYYLYRDIEPITESNLGTPYREFDRFTKNYIDSGMEVNTPYFYRVSPKTFLGSMLSNEVELVHYTQFSILFSSQNTTETTSYIPLRVDDNIIPLIPESDVNHDQINFTIVERVVSDISLKSEYIPTTEYILMRVL